MRRCVPDTQRKSALRISGTAAGILRLRQGGEDLIVYSCLSVWDGQTTIRGYVRFIRASKEYLHKKQVKIQHIKQMKTVYLK